MYAEIPQTTNFGNITQVQAIVGMDGKTIISGSPAVTDRQSTTFCETLKDPKAAQDVMALMHAAIANQLEESPEPECSDE